MLFLLTNRYNLASTTDFFDGKKIMKMRSLWALAVVFLAVLVTFPFNFQNAGSAVSVNGKCALPSFQKAFQDSDAVFVGEVISQQSKSDVKIYDFQVERYWKGKGLKNIQVTAFETPRFQSSFEKGKRYLIYAVNDGKGNLVVGRCSQSKNIEDATADLRKLGKGKRPRK